MKWIKWACPLLLFASPAFAQIEVPSWSKFQETQTKADQALDGTTTNASNILQILQDLEKAEDRIRALEDQSTEPPVEPLIDPPIPPVKPDNFAKLCAEPGVRYCQGFDVDLSEAAFNNGADRNYPIAVDNEIYADGGGSLRLTIDGGSRQEVTGTIGYDFPLIASGTFYVGLKMRFGDGLQTLLRSQGFNHNAAGMKFFQIVPGSRSCASQEIVFTDTVFSAWLTGVPGLVYSCSGLPVQTASGAYQPHPDPVTSGCRWSHLKWFRDNPGNKVDWEPCRVFEDDTWHQIELEVAIGTGYRLWIDGNLVIQTQGADLKHPRSAQPAGPYGRFYMSNYMTGYFDPKMLGSYTFGDGLWRVYYDNLIISRDCITSCGG